MIVHSVGIEELEDGTLARTATVRRADAREVTVDVVVPAEFAPPEPDDATGALPLALLLAMRLGEDLRIEARVDAELLARTGELQRYYEACGGGRLRPVKIHAAGTLAPKGSPVPRAASFFSRGVDSLYQAALRRTAHGELDALVFVDRLEPIHDDIVRAQERRLAAVAAGAIGLPLVFAEAPLRELADSLFDWEDAVGAGLAWVGHALAGGLGRIVIPSTDSVHCLTPTGVGPVIDPLFSSRRLHFDGSDITETRMGKVAWLAHHRQELLPLLKVCYAANRPDNCGRCGKCLHTMACLRAAGALELASGFPSELDLEEFASQRHGLLSVMVEMAAVRDAAVAAGDLDLVAATDASRRRSVTPRRASKPSEGPSFRSLHSRTIMALLRDGTPEPEAARGDIGLVRAIDLRGRHHVHGAGWRPSGVVCAELGALQPDGTEATVPVWVVADGRIATLEVSPAGARAGLVARALHAAAPLVGQGGLRRAVRRMLDLAVLRPLGPAAADTGTPPHGYLHAEPGADRIALWVGEHPITGDQYTAATSSEVLQAGYAGPRLLGYLDARAPLTGRLGVHATPIIPWA